jgi:tRNA 2-thiouridine synthesizing protein C
MANAMIMIRSAPSADLETAELALALAAFDHKISLVFMGAGLLWLLNNQQERKPGGKSPSKLMNALPIYDCEDIYYSRTDLEYLQLDRSCINTVARELEPEDIQQLITKQQFCLSF